MIPEIYKDQPGFRLEGDEIQRAAELLAPIATSMHFERPRDAAAFHTDCVVIDSAVEIDSQSVWVHNRTGHFLQGLFDVAELNTTETETASTSRTTPFFEHIAKKP